LFVRLKALSCNCTTPFPRAGEDYCTTISKGIGFQAYAANLHTKNLMCTPSRLCRTPYYTLSQYEYALTFAPKLYHKCLLLGMSFINIVAWSKNIPTKYMLLPVALSIQCRTSYIDLSHVFYVLCTLTKLSLVSWSNTR